jgi:hypothetical protein
MRIEDPQALNALLAKKGLNDLELQIPHLSAEENRIWLKKIKKDYYACGCETGTAFLVAGILFTGLFFFWEIINNSSFHLHASLIIYAVLILFIMSAIGKFLGLLISSIRLKKNVRLLVETFADNQRSMRFTGADESVVNGTCIT